MAETASGPLPLPPIDPAVMRRAAEWIVQLGADDVSDQDLADCQQWRARHPDHEQAWQRLMVFETMLGSVPREAARRALHAPAANGRRRALRVLGLGALAAGAGYVAHGTETWQRAAADYRSATGEILSWTLPDGTQLVLGSDAAVDLRFTADERLLVLLAGEILVTTAVDTAPLPRPLRVRTRHGTVQALGTRFAVRDDTDASRIAVFEGAVEIRPTDNPHATFRVQAGQGASFSRRQVEALVPVTESAAAWSQGVLVADDMRLDTLLAELGRYRTGLLRCDPQVASLRVSGVFSLRDTDRALHNLTRALPVRTVYRTRYWVTVQAAG